MRKKKAAGRIKLCHVTSAQTLLKIADSGQIMPSGYTGNSVNIYTTNKKQQSSGTDQGGVYLLKDGSGLAEIFGDNSTAKSSDGIYPNFPVVLEVYVDTDALTPDYDDINNMHANQEYDTYDTKGLKNVLDQNSKLDTEEYWKKSLDVVGHVVHQGPIDVSDIQNVQLDVKHYNVYRGSKMQELCTKNRDAVDQYFVGNFYQDNYGAEDNIGLSFSAAVESIKALFAELDKIYNDTQNQQQNATAHIKSRLKKLS